MITMWWAASMAWAGVSVSPAPTRGEVSQVLLANDDGSPQSGVTVRAIVHPERATSAEIGLGITDAKGRIAWTPKDAGTADLYAGDVHLTRVVVAWPTPPTGVVVPWALMLLVAGGAVAFGLGYGREEGR